MNLADVFTVVFVILGLLIVFVGCWLMAAGLFPQRVARCAEQLGLAPVKCALVGLASATPLVALGILVGKAVQSGAGKFGTFVIVVSTILLALFGTAGLALRIGQGLRSARDEQEPWRRVLRGGVVLALSYGTIVLLPVTLLAGFGAVVLSLGRRTAPVAAVDPVKA